jgi:acetoacetyl-CoA reductase
MAQGDWGRIVLIEWLDDYAADTEAERANKEGSFAKLASKLASRGVTINTIVTVKGNVEDGEDFSQSGRLSKYEEIAGLTAYLVTDEAGFLSGARIAFDVGRRLA